MTRVLQKIKNIIYGSREKKITFNEKLYKEICSLTELELLKKLKKKYKKYAVSTKDNEKYLYLKGNIPILLIAHLDTVFPTPPTDFFVDREQGVILSPQGAGADDRAGVTAIMQILDETELKPYVLFTTGEEEIGVVGAVEFISDYPSPPADLLFMIELDGQGRNDAVFYFSEDYLLRMVMRVYGYEEQMGSFTDICVIAPTWNISAVNVSIGYLREHTLGETLYISWYEESLNTIIKMLRHFSKLEEPFPICKYYREAFDLY